MRAVLVFWRACAAACVVCLMLLPAWGCCACCFGRFGVRIVGGVFVRAFSVLCACAVVRARACVCVGVAFSLLLRACGGCVCAVVFVVA